MLSNLSLTDAVLFTMLFEALLICLSLPDAKSDELIMWTETITEAFFVHKAIHGKETSEEGEDEYTLEVLDQISKVVDVFAE